MLTNTFCHIPGIGEKTEQSLWAAGVVSWDVDLGQASARLSRSRQDSVRNHLEESVRRYEQRDAGYFGENLPGSQHWRLYRDFQDCCAFVDIETTGLDFPAEITTIALYDGRSVRHYVNGQNLNEFARDIQDYRLLVTYNGKQFDVPRIEQCFGIKLTQAHVDLRYPLRSLGLTGGLKGCERQLGMVRPGMEDVDGFVAVLLWHEYRNRKDPRALETLLAYNIQDTVSLHALVVHAYNEKVKATPFSGSHSLPAPSLPAVPFTPDHETLERVRRRASSLGYGWGFSGSRY